MHGVKQSSNDSIISHSLASGRATETVTIFCFSLTSDIGTGKSDLFSAQLSQCFSWIQEKCVVRMHSSGPDLTRVKHFGGSEQNTSGAVALPTKFMMNWPD